MDKKGNKIENWNDAYKEHKTSYSEELTTPANIVNYMQYQFVYEDIQKYLPHIEKAKILEVGCGGARTSLFLSLKGLNVTCSDFSPEAIRLAKDNFASANASGTFFQDDFLNSKLEAESYDCVMSFGLLEHFEELQPVVKNLTKLIKPGGIQIHCVITKKISTQTIMNYVLYPYRFLINALIERNYQNILRRSFRDFPHYENSFSEREYCKVFKNERNTIIRCEAEGVLFPFFNLPLGIGYFIVQRFSGVLSFLIRITNRTESRVLHLISPCFYIVCRKNKILK